MSWADDHGYEHISCGKCGWSGWTDTGVCEGCPEPEHDTCEDCGVVLDGDHAHRDYSAEGRLCEDCGSAEGVTHCTGVKSTVHTARKDHGPVKAGDLYRRTVRMGYTVGGPRWMTVEKRVLRPAA